MRDAKLGDLGAEEREDSVRIVSAVLVDRDDLERQRQRAQMFCGPAHRNADGLLVVTKRQDDGDVEPRTVGHCLGE